MRAIERTNNRTGLGTSPDLAAALQSTIPTNLPSVLPEEDGLATVRVEYAEEAEPVGSMPPPATLGTAVKSMAKRLLGEDEMVLMDKLGERLAFERSGVRLYQGLISKHEVHGSWKGGPSAEDLKHIRDEEHQHFKLIETAMKELGGDPTAMTPSADLHGVISKGLPAAIADPRTDLRESLEAILVAELVDNDCWETLSDLARALGHEDHAARFDQALEEEREHLEKVRAWIAAGLNLAAAGDPAEASSQRRASAKRAAATERMRQKAAKPKRITKGGSASRSSGSHSTGRTSASGRKTKSAAPAGRSKTKGGSKSRATPKGGAKGRGKAGSARLSK